MMIIRPEKIEDYGCADWKKLDKNVVDKINEIIDKINKEGL